LIKEILEKVKDDYSRVLENFIDSNFAFRRTPQTNTFNVKYYGGTPTEFNNIKSHIINNVSGYDTYSLYLHYPYCKYICSFCHYPVLKHTSETQNLDVINYLVKHFDLLCEQIPEITGKKVSSFYVGGGTPSLLSIDNLKTLKKLLVDKIKFENDAELTIETTPDSLTDDRIKQLIDIGFNRLSVGVQILDNEALERLKRDHKLEQALNIIDLIKTHKELTSNVDLIYGLPGISSEKFLNDVDTIAKSGIDSITLYRLRLGRKDERKAALYNDYAQNTQKYPSQRENMIQIIASRKLLSNSGFFEEPIGWFNKRKNSNKCYRDRWMEQSPMFGLGLAAYSYGHNWQFLNKKNIKELNDNIRQRILPFGEGSFFNDEEALLRRCAFKLRFDGRFSIDNLLGNYQQRIYRIFTELCDLKLGDLDNLIFKLNDLGTAFIDEIIDNYFQKFHSYYSNNNGEEIAIK
jgi:oxygen-independent coproporphyrinogen III oxidase